MSGIVRRAAVYFEPELYEGARLEAAHTHRTVSDIVNDAVRISLREDQDDLVAFDERRKEPSISYEALLRDLTKYGKL